MAFTLDNFVRSTLAVAAAAADTSLVLTLAAPPLRNPPVPAAGDVGVLILMVSSPSIAIEVVTYTGVSIVGTQVTLTGVLRAQEGTTAQAWDVGAQAFSGNTAAVMASKADTASLGSAAYSNNGDFAPAALGVLAGTAVQRTGDTMTGALVLRTPDDSSYHNVLGIGPSDNNKDFYCAMQNGAIKWTHNGWYGTGSIQWNLPGGGMSLDYSGNLTVTGGATVGGNVLLRPNGNGSAVGQASLSSNGQLNISQGVGVNAAAVQLNPAGTGRSIQYAATQDSTLGIWDVTNQAWLMVIDPGNTITFAGNVTAPNIGPRIYTQSGDPGAVPDGSLWVW